MNIDYSIVIPVALAVVLLLVFLVRRNYKDKKKFEKDIMDEELKAGEREEE